MTCVCGGGGLFGLWKALTERLVVVLLVLVLPGVPWWGVGCGTRGGVASRGVGTLLGSWPSGDGLVGGGLDSLIAECFLWWGFWVCCLRIV